MSKHMGKRKTAHIYRFTQEEYGHIVLYKAFNKYGIENFTFEIIEEIEDEGLLSEREKHWITYYNSFEKGYNMTLGGDGGATRNGLKEGDSPNSLLTKEDVLKMREAYASCSIKGKDYWEENLKDKISYSGFRRVWYGQLWKHVRLDLVENNREAHQMFLHSIHSDDKKVITDEEIETIRDVRVNGDYVCKEYWEMFYKDRVSLGHFEHIWRGDRRQDVAMETYSIQNHAERRKRLKSRGVKNNILLESYEVYQIIAFLEGMTLQLKEIADIFGVSENTIRSINDLKTFTNLHDRTEKIRPTRSTYIRSKKETD